MSYSLGIDTGGTYTDAALIRDERDVVATAKSLTTRHDLSVGIGNAVRAVLERSQVDPLHIKLASLSTTLATNALVEGQGGRVALIFIGFQEKDIETNGLKDALNEDPFIVLAGGHSHAGHEKEPLDEPRLVEFLQEHGAHVSGFAIAAQFAVRNPAHELKAMALVRDLTARPASASHQLSAKLGGPKRALTAVLNARLIGMIDRLIVRAEGALEALGIEAPMMVVRGDGALISATQAREKPIETILSGPAASIVGASWMTNVQTALVSDIGGTTTDIALLQNGRPAIDPQGARVGPYRTMVEAVAMRTTGLGGDSEIHCVTEGLSGGVTLGPRRVLPVSLLAQEAPETVHAALDAALRSTTPGEYDARFVRPVAGAFKEGLAERDQRLLDRIGTGVHPMGDVLRNRMEHGALRRLVDRGIVQVSGPTPSDASHVLERVAAWDPDAARKALELLARKRTGSGDRLAKDATALAQVIVDQLTKQTSLALLEAAFSEETQDFGASPDVLARHPLVHQGLAGHAGLLRISAALNVPVVGLGASAHSYYPAVGLAVGSDMILPEHAGVANAIGAVVGRISMRASGTVISEGEGRFVVHISNQLQTFADQDAALSALGEALAAKTAADAQAAGAEDVHVSETREIQTARVEGRDVFVEATLTVEASGRPTIANS